MKNNKHKFKLDLISHTMNYLKNEINKFDAILKLLTIASL